MASKHVDAVVDACSSAVAGPAVDPPETLYHLTDSVGFAGIISSRTLWSNLATSLNDASEIRYGVDLTVELLRERLANRQSDFDAAALGFLLDPSSAPKANQYELFPFVVSFCKHCAKSGQWLHYGRSGHGVALGFSPDIATALGMDLCSVDYDPQSQRTRIASLLDSAHAALGPSPTQEQIREGAHLASMYISWLAVRFKHPSFVEEDEWRLSSQVIVKGGQIQDQSVLKFRESAGRLVPYEERVFNDASLLKLVVVGFSSTTTPEAARLMLVNHGYRASATRSDVPVR